MMGMGLIVYTFMLGTAQAQENNGNVSVGAGVDVVSEYYFRGIVQETNGFIYQPWLEAGIAINDRFSVAGGTWNSVHSVQAVGPTTPSWYESDFYLGSSYAVSDGMAVDLTYTKYMSPRSSWGSVSELALGLGVENYFSPYATVAIEIDSGGGADGGSKDGTYLELGIEPAMPLDTEALSISLPVAVGLSLGNYYENGADNNTFGFLSASAALSAPLTNIPTKYGSWEFAGSIGLLVFGDGLKGINDSNDSAKLIATVGLSLGY
jgi:uncharacterized protein (TIGR02001 family)